MKRNYLTTFASEAVVVIGYLVTFRLVAQHLGTIGFGEYALSRRALAFLVPIGMLGVDMAIARCLAYGVGAGADAQYRAAALVSVLTSVSVVSGFLVIFQGPIAHLFYGSQRLSQLVVTLPVLILGSALHGIAYGDLRGRLRIQKANLLMAVNQGLIPVVAALVAPTAVLLLLAIGIAWSAVSGGAIVASQFSMEGLGLRLNELLGYGLRRIPGDLIQLALFAAPSIIVAQQSDITQAGVVAFGVAGLGMVGSALTPIQFVLLPVAARYLATGSISELRAHLGRLVPWVVVVLVAGTTVIEITAPALVRAYLGTSFDRGADVLRLVMWSALPWGMVVTLRSVIDARHFRAVNARNMAMGFAVFLTATVGSWFVSGAQWWVSIVGFDLGIAAVAVLTIVEVSRIASGSGHANASGKTAANTEGDLQASLVDAELRSS